MKILNSITTAAASDYLATTKTAMDEARAAEILEDAPNVAVGSALSSWPKKPLGTAAGAGAGALTGVAARAMLNPLGGKNKAIKGDPNAILKRYAMSAILGAIPGAVVGRMVSQRSRKKDINAALGEAFPDTDPKTIMQAKKKENQAPGIWKALAGTAGAGLGAALLTTAMLRKLPTPKGATEAFKGRLAKGGAESFRSHIPEKTINKFLKGVNSKSIAARKAAATKGSLIGGVGGYIGGSALGNLAYRGINKDEMKEKAIQHLINKSRGEEVSAGGERQYPGSASDLAGRGMAAIKGGAEKVYGANKSAYEKLMAMVRKDGDGVPMIEAPE